jgi:hypothetical protein
MRRKYVSVGRITVLVSILVILLAWAESEMANRRVEATETDDTEEGLSLPAPGAGSIRASGEGIGVRGEARISGGAGIAGYCNLSGGIGVFGTGSKWGGYFEGDGYISGKLGIGTTAPNQLLHMVGASPRILIEGSSGNPEVNFKNTGEAVGLTWALYKNSVTNDLRFYQNGDRISIQSATGNLGIGTTSPQQKLHVNGIAQFDVGGGSVSMSTPGGWPGIIAYAQNGHRRDIFFFDDSLNIAVSTSGSLSSETNGVKIHEDGMVEVKTLKLTGGLDLAEQFEVRGKGEIVSPAPGMVVTIDSQNPGELIVSSEAYDRKVAGVISGAGGIDPGMLLSQTTSDAKAANPIALTGRVYTYADAFYGPIEPGDLLTTSDTPGHAMKVADFARAQGAILGKAMTSIQEGKGLVLVLVTLQ